MTKTMNELKEEKEKLNREINGAMLNRIGIPEGTSITMNTVDLTFLRTVDLRKLKKVLKE